MFDPPELVGPSGMSSRRGARFADSSYSTLVSSTTRYGASLNLLPNEQRIFPRDRSDSHDDDDSERAWD